MSVDEMRLTIKLMIHSFKREGDSSSTFLNYTKVTQAALLMTGISPNNKALSSYLLKDLNELLDCV